MMTSAQIRQSFLDFFHEKHHTVVSSSSLMPDSPNLLFTNAGMNQFVPIFLGQKNADVSRWAGVIPASDSRAADTQKCIRAGGKHNDLEDVGLDTYHHTFFEMLGNWSFGDYFKKEAISWAWELVIERWKFPPQRLYATVYQPAAGDPSERDQEAWEIWAGLFRGVGLDPSVHIVDGNKKDNFWMMGETGPCGPCSELHVDLTPAGDTGGALVNKGTAECIEIWNLVFIQFNANPDGTFEPLPSKHVDTGMGFERVCSIIQGTKGFSEMGSARISNYETDIFRPIFDELERMSGQRYGSTLPQMNAAGQLIAVTDQEKVDVAFRVIADHIRTLSFAIADGIQPGNTDRNYVLRRILRRAVRYGRQLGLRGTFFFKLSDVLAEHMGDVFPEIRNRLSFVRETLRREEEAFNKTLDRGVALFESEVRRLESLGQRQIGGAFAFDLYDTSGFPIDLTELMARERGFGVDLDGFQLRMEEQRTRARAAQKKVVIELSQVETMEPTKFVGYENLQADAKVLEVAVLKDRLGVVLDVSPAYAELGGQVGDTGEISAGAAMWRIANTVKNGATWLHFLEGVDAVDAPQHGQTVQVTVDRDRRRAVERHHTVTHLLHWALHEVVSRNAVQKGSFVGADKMTFDFSSAPLTPTQVLDVEKLVNERILENAPVSWTERPYGEIKSRSDVLQFFGDKYGDLVRVVQIGGSSGLLDGYSMELCGGTHTRSTGEIGSFRILAEGAISSGIRRIEANAGLPANRLAAGDTQRLRAMAMRLGSPVGELERKIESITTQCRDLEKALATANQRQAAQQASALLEAVENMGGTPAIVREMRDITGDQLQSVVESLKGRFEGIIALVGISSGQVAIVASSGSAFSGKISAGKLVQAMAAILGGKGGGRPDFARGAGKDESRVAEALRTARGLIGG